MEVMVNSKPVEMEEEASLLNLIESLKLDPDALVAEVNGEVTGREAFEKTTLKPNDRLELVRIVGGG